MSAAADKGGGPGKRKNVRTLSSATQLSFRQLRRNQETLSDADRARYWQTLAEHCEQEATEERTNLRKRKEPRHV